MSAATVRPSVAALMNGLIDYAGLFPPARLDLDTAIKNYAAFLSSDDRWMLSRFIVPSRLLVELNPYAALFEKNKPFRFSITGQPSEAVDEFEAHIVQDLDKIHAFKETLKKLVSPDLLEILLPVAAARDDGDLDALLAWVDRMKAQRNLSHLQIFYELDWRGDWQIDLARGANALERFNLQRDHSHPEVGLKLRCGGVNPADVPDPEIVATALHLAATHKLPFKATAGLHHPFRHFREEYGGWMHGFVNVFVGGILAREHDLSVETLKMIISETDPTAFRFEQDEIRCDGWGVPLSVFVEERRRAMISYGSCSFDEPREDLQALNLL